MGLEPCLSNRQPALQIASEEMCEPLRHAGDQRPLAPLLEDHLLRLFQVAIEQGFHLRGKIDADDDRVHLVVVEKTPEVHVRGADRGPGPVDHRGLGMDHRTLALIELDACLEEGGVFIVAGSEGESRIALLGQDDLHIDPASGRVDQRVVEAVKNDVRKYLPATRTDPADWKSGKSVDEMIAAEAGPSGFEPSDAEIGAWYKDNASRVGNRSLDQVRSQVADLLRTEKRKAAEQKLQDRINADRKVTVAYQPYRLQFDNAKAPTFGKPDAPVTLVEFSDFQCPFCRAAAPALRQVENKFGDKVQIVYRQFPIPSLHPNAFKAAEASLCANEQGKFWEMHDVMFEDQTKLAVSDLKQTARKLGMDGKKFDACLDTGRYVEQVQNDQRDGQRIGVSGTPAIYINGVLVDGGSVPFSTLEAKIQKELQRGKS